MTVYGYCRISTAKQSLDRQVSNIMRYNPAAKIVKEVFTGTVVSRPEWDKLKKKLVAGDTVIFDSVSRMSRNAADGFAEYEQLYRQNINLVFIKEPHINTDTYRNAMQVGLPMTGTNVDFILEGVNKYLLALAKEQIRLAFDQSQKEVDDMRQRTREGIAEAKKRGEQVGRQAGAVVETKKGKAVQEYILKYCKDFGGSLSDSDVMDLAAKQLGHCSRNTFYKYKSMLKADPTLTQISLSEI